MYDAVVCNFTDIYSFKWLKKKPEKLNCATNYKFSLSTELTLVERIFYLEPIRAMLSWSFTPHISLLLEINTKELSINKSTGKNKP